MMFVLDTNVVSEGFKPLPSVTVSDWWTRQDDADVWLTSISVQEIDVGLHCMPKGKRQDALWMAWRNVLQQKFQHQMLTFDENSAHATAQLMAMARSVGRAMAWPDAQIAGIAAQYDATLVTRNTKDFEGLGLKLLNPWEVQI